MNISFIICCHNSAPRLPATLAHLGAVERLPEVEWEVVVVDNASTDNTAEAAQRCWLEEDAPAPLHVVREPTPGLIHARRRGVHAARHEIVCFIDDDNWIGPNWPFVLCEVFTAQPDVGAVGGLGRPVFECTEPHWFTSVQWAYAVGPQAPRSGEVPPARGYLYGAGLSLRRSALLDLQKRGFQPLLTGRKGAELLAGEDSELCCALALAGWRLWYDDRLVFDHFISSERLTASYGERLVEQLGYASAYIDAYMLAGAAARPWRWTLLNRFFLTRVLWATLKYALGMFLSHLTKRGNMRLHFLRGRFRGVVLGRRSQASLRRDLCDFRRCLPESFVDKSSRARPGSGYNAPGSVI